MLKVLDLDFGGTLFGVGTVAELGNKMRKDSNLYSSSIMNVEYQVKSFQFLPVFKDLLPIRNINIRSQVLGRSEFALM